MHFPTINIIGRLLKTARSSYYITIVGGKIRYSSRKGTAREKKRNNNRTWLNLQPSLSPVNRHWNTPLYEAQLLHSTPFHSPLDYRRTTAVGHYYTYTCAAVHDNGFSPFSDSPTGDERSFMYFYDGSISTSIWNIYNIL